MILAILLAASAWGITVNPASNVTGDSAATRLTVVYRDTEGGAAFATLEAASIGVSTPTPGGSLDVKAISSSEYVLRVSSNNSTTMFAVRQNGHVIHLGVTPAISDCGTAPAITGNDTAGSITLGSGVGGTCVLTFAAAYAAPPACLCGNQTTGQSCRVSVVSETALTFAGTFGNSDVITYLCKGIE